MIPAFIIALNNESARKSVDVCLDSIRQTKSPITASVFPAIDHLRVETEMANEGLEYTYPLGVSRMEYGMNLYPYETKDIRKRIGCFMSHYRLWQMISENICPYSFAIILEQDAEFTNTFDVEYFEEVLETNFICSLNSPMNATRKASVFDRKLKLAHKEENDTGEMSTEEDEVLYHIPPLNHFKVPWIDTKDIPQGLPGNSAYIITPSAADHLIKKTHEIGIWPNDALICKQFFDEFLYCAYPYITKVQGKRSTTTL